MTNPRLALIPSAYKASKIYSILPADGDGDFVFKRSTTATRVNKDGLVEEVAENIPRLDYTNGACPELLLEGASTNLCLYSQSNFNDQVNWRKFLAPNNLTVTEDDVIAPDGTLTGAKIEYINSGGNGVFTQNITVVNGNSYVLSIWLKGEQGGEVVNLRLSNSASSFSGTSDTFTLTDEWVRYSTDIKVADGVDRGFQLIIEPAANPLGATFYAWGAQLENNTFATSYIPTEATAVTRVKDIMYSEEISLPKSGVLYAEMKAFTSDYDAVQELRIRNQIDVQRVVIRYTNATNQITAFVFDGTLKGVVNYTDVDITEFHKIAYKYESGSQELYVDGFLVGSATDSYNITEDLDEISSAFGNSGTGNSAELILKDLRVYDTLTAEEIKAL